MKPLTIVVAVLAVLATAAMVRADAMSDLQGHFKERLAHLRELKQAGTVGETAAGLVDFVHPEGADAATQQFVQAENDDRTALYKLLAAKEGTTADQVAKINAQRNFEKARAGEWLKDESGQWKQKS